MGNITGYTPNQSTKQANDFYTFIPEQKCHIDWKKMPFHTFFPHILHVSHSLTGNGRV